MPTKKNPANQKTPFWEITPNTENPESLRDTKRRVYAELKGKIDEAQSAQRKLEEASAPGANQAALVSVRDDIREALGNLLLLSDNSDIPADNRLIFQAFEGGSFFAERAQTTAKAAFNAAVQRDKGVEPVTAPAQAGTGAAEKNSLSAPLVQDREEVNRHIRNSIIKRSIIVAGIFIIIEFIVLLICWKYGEGNNLLLKWKSLWELQGIPFAVSSLIFYLIMGRNRIRYLKWLKGDDVDISED